MYKTRNSGFVLEPHKLKKKKLSIHYVNCYENELN